MTIYIFKNRDFVEWKEKVTFLTVEDLLTEIGNLILQKNLYKIKKGIKVS